MWGIDIEMNKSDDELWLDCAQVPSPHGVCLKEAQGALLTTISTRQGFSARHSSVTCKSRIKIEKKD